MRHLVVAFDPGGTTGCTSVLVDTEDMCAHLFDYHEIPVCDAPRQIQKWLKFQLPGYKRGANGDQRIDETHIVCEELTVRVRAFRPVGFVVTGMILLAAYNNGMVVKMQQPHCMKSAHAMYGTRASMFVPTSEHCKDAFLHAMYYANRTFVPRGAGPLNLMVKTVGTKWCKQLERGEI